MLGGLLPWRKPPSEPTRGPASCSGRFTLRPLEDLAEPAASFMELCGGGRPVAYLQFSDLFPITLQPSFMLGENGRNPYAYRSSRIPPTRLYRFTGETLVYGKGLLLRGDEMVRFDDFKFDHLGSFAHPFHATVVQAQGDTAEVTLPTRQRAIEGPCLLLSQDVDNIWGHWLVDLLPRLALAMTCPAPMRVILDRISPPSWVSPFFARFGIPDDRIVWHDAGHEILSFRDLYLPTYLRRGNALSPLANMAWQPFRASGAPVAGRRLYVSRARLPASSSLVNHAEIEAMARQRDYRVLHPETMSIAAQIAAFAGAETVVGEFGSGLHNTVFSPAGTRVAVLQPPDMASFVQAGIGHVRAQPTGFAFGEPAGAPRRMHLAPDLFEEVLDRLDA